VNRADPIGRVVFNALHSRRASENDTGGFDTLKHNDHLCPTMQSRLDDLLASCRRNFNVVYDVQGVNDSGVDVVVRLSDGDESEYIAFQIKADDELPPATLVSKLKTQYFDAITKYGNELSHYYIVPCADLTKKGRRDRIRLLTATFATTLNLTVIDPQYSWNFLYAASQVEEQAIVTAYISDEDPLVVAASKLAASLTVVQLRTLLAVLAHYVSDPGEAMFVHDLTSNRHISEAVSVVEMLTTFGMPLNFVIPRELQLEGQEAIVPNEGDFDALMDYVDVEEGNRVIFSGLDEDELVALAYEGKARYELKGEKLSDYLESLLSVQYQKEPFEWSSFESLFEMVETIAEQSRQDDEEILARLLELNWSDSQKILADLNLNRLKDLGEESGLNTEIIDALRAYEDPEKGASISDIASILFDLEPLIANAAQY